MTKRWLWPWDAYLLVCLVVVIVLIVRESEEGPAARAVAVAALALIALGWAGYGRRVARDDAQVDEEMGAAGWYLAGTVTLFAVAIAAADIGTFALFAVCPIAFICLPLRPALAAVAVVNLLPPMVEILHPDRHGDLRIEFGIAAIGLTFSALIGTSMDRTTRQSQDRARLITELEATRAEVAALSHQAGVAAERSRLAAEIHDTLAQGFTSIITLLQAAEGEDRAAADRHLAMALRTARDNLAEARAMVTVLSPAGLRTGTLAEVITRQVERLGEETGAVTACAIEDMPGQLPTAVEVVLVRAVQEALANVRKHAGAGTVTVDLIGSPGIVRLTVTDDGAGFDPAPEPGGYGLRGMRARAAQAGGRLTVTSAPGEGTTIALELPA